METYSNTFKKRFRISLPTEPQLLDAARTLYSTADRIRTELGVWVLDSSGAPAICYGAYHMQPKHLGSAATLYFAFTPLDDNGEPDTAFLDAIDASERDVLCSISYLCGNNGILYKVSEKRRTEFKKRSILTFHPSKDAALPVSVVKAGNALVSTSGFSQLQLIDLWDTGILPRQMPATGRKILVDGEEMFMAPADFASDIEFAFEFLAGLNKQCSLYVCRVPGVAEQPYMALEVNNFVSSPMSVNYSPLPKGNIPLCPIVQLTPVSDTVDTQSVEGETVPVCSLYSNSVFPPLIGKISPLELAPPMNLDEVIFGAPVEEDTEDLVVYGTWHNGSLYLRQPLFFSSANTLKKDFQKFFGVII